MAPNLNPTHLWQSLLTAHVRKTVSDGEQIFEGGLLNDTTDDVSAKKIETSKVPPSKVASLSGAPSGSQQENDAFLSEDNDGEKEQAGLRNAPEDTCAPHHNISQARPTFTSLCIIHAMTCSIPIFLGGG